MGHLSTEVWWCDNCGKITKPQELKEFGAGDSILLCNTCHSDSMVKYHNIKRSCDNYPDNPIGG